jgi:hypothetical protein
VAIKYVFETHRNEDYVVGSTELSNFTGAKIFHGPGLNWGYGTTLRDGEVFHIVDLKLIALHTPGHTDESMSWLTFLRVKILSWSLPAMRSLSVTWVELTYMALRKHRD